MFGKKNTNKEKAVEKTAAIAAAPSNGLMLTGIVVSTKMKDTIVVKVDRFIKVPKYERYMKSSKKFKAHDAGNTKKEGEKVTIVETKPYSKDKHFKVVA